MKNKKQTTLPGEPQPAANENMRQSSPGARTAGFLLLLPAVIALAAGLYMFFVTRGTRLLFLAASTGQLYGQYPVFLIVGAVLLLAAILLLRANPASALPQKPETAPKEVPETPKAPEAPEAQPAEPAEKPAPARVCPGCGAAVGDGDQFCLKCGNSLAAAGAQKNAAAEQAEAPAQTSDGEMREQCVR